MNNSHFVTRSLVSITTLLLHVFAMPVFFLGFLLIYDSSWMTRFLDAGLGTVFNVLMLTSILIGVVGISRIKYVSVGGSTHCGASEKYLCIRALQHCTWLWYMGITAISLL